MNHLPYPGSSLPVCNHETQEIFQDRQKLGTYNEKQEFMKSCIESESRKRGIPFNVICMNFRR